MADYRLSNTQRNEILNVAVKIGLDPAGLLWAVEEDQGAWSHTGHRLEHPATGAFVRIMHVLGPYYSFAYWPKTVVLPHVPDGDWRGLLAVLTRWLRAVKEESETPDFWEAARKGQEEWLGGPEPEENTPFAEAEVRQIEERLGRIEGYLVETHRPEAEQRGYVRRQLEYLAAAARRIGRIDWKNIAFSAMLRIASTLGLAVSVFLGVASGFLGELVGAATD